MWWRCVVQSKLASQWTGSITRFCSAAMLTDPRVGGIATPLAA